MRRRGRSVAPRGPGSVRSQRDRTDLFTPTALPGKLCCAFRGGRFDTFNIRK
jgi:hypothetical protein